MTDPDRTPETRPPHDDEISLIDLWRVLERRKWWIVIIAAVTLVLGSGYGFMQTPQYQFQTPVLLGQQGSGSGEGSRVLVNIEYLSDVLIPWVHMEQQQDPEVRSLKVAVQPFANNTLLLTTSAALEYRDDARELHRHLVSVIREEEAREIEDLRAGFAWDRRRMETEYRMQLRSLEHEAKTIQARLKDAEEREQLLEIESRFLVQRIQQVEPLSERITDLIMNPSVDLSLQLWAQPPQTKLLEMYLSTERGLAIELPRRFHELQQNMAELERKGQRVADYIEYRQHRHELDLAELERNEARIRETSIIGRDYALASPSPEGSGRSLFVALSLALGLMLGVFGAFFREFLARVRASETA